MKRSPACAFLVVAMSAGLGQAKADIPRHPGIDELTSCTLAPAARPCRIAVSNHQFDGPSDDYRYTHGYQPQYFWQWPHSMAEHIVPWIYLDRCGTGYAMADADADFVLKCPGDAVTQTISLPPVPDGASIGYTAHAHVGSWSGYMDVRMDVELLENGQVIATSNAIVQIRTPYRSPLSELSSWIDVPEGRRPEAMRLSITASNGWGQAPLDDIFVVRAHPDSYVPQLQPQPIKASRWQ